MSGMELTRRSFLKGAAVLGGAGMVAGLAGCSPADSEAPDAGAAEAADWLGQPEEVDIDGIATVEEAEVVVVGAGFAGQCAAASAIDHGAKSVILLEKCPTYRVGGALTGTVNSRLHKELGAEYDPAFMYQEFMKGYNFAVDSHMVMDWAYKSGEIQDWLFDKCDAAGVDYTIYTKYPDDFDFSKEIAATYRIGVAIDTTVHDDMSAALKVLDDFILANGGVVKYSTPGNQLIKDETGRVTGVVAKNEETGEFELYNATKGVILCTGDYGANLDMCNAFLEPESAEMAAAGTCYAMKSDPSTAGANTGDGHKMACWAGAQMEPGVHATMAWNTTGFFNMPFLHVNKQGERFMNEALTAAFWPRQIYRQPGKVSYQITDANFAEHVAKMQPATPDGLMTEISEKSTEAWEQDNGWVSADSLEELAEKLGIPADKFVKTIERYNSLEGGIDYDEGKLGKYIIALDTPPFKAAEIHYTMAVTLGGVLVNDHLQVRDAEGAGIPGLYAAGNTVGRRYSRYYEDILTGNSNAFALVHGYLSGQYCMEDNA
ncbi:MAG: FAD-dependent oxidoreductase [Eggerthellaceae bacterium]|nr:FAD-dependent oxidoreductase [Eggerthellaceae bacterium]